jgi:hypothetical protein
MRYAVILSDKNTLTNAPLDATGQAWFQGRWQDPATIKNLLRIEAIPSERESFPRQRDQYGGSR